MCNRDQPDFDWAYEFSDQTGPETQNGQIGHAGLD